MSLTATFDPTLSRVRLSATALDDGTEALFERSKNGVKWSTVRGGSAVTISVGDTAKVDDYEFVPGMVNYYRVKAGSDTFTTTITPDQQRVWLKSISRPFLNRAVNVLSHEDITVPARNGVFPIIGRSNPVAVTDVRLTRRWEMTLWVDTISEADSLELVFASGDPLYIQVPPTKDIPGGYVVVGDVVRGRYGTVSTRRTFRMDVTTVAAPTPDVVGSTVTWQDIIDGYSTWSDVISGFSTWGDVLEVIADPETVYVP
jgi:hypothetical protein